MTVAKQSLASNGAPKLELGSENYSLRLINRKLC